MNIKDSRPKKHSFTQEMFEAALQRERERKSNKVKDNRPPEHLRTLKRGDVREDGMVFLNYCPSRKSGERWVTPEKLEALNQKSKDYRQKHLKQVRRSDRYRYTKRRNNPDFWEQRYKYIKHRRLIDVNFRIACNLRTRLHSALNGKSKSKATLELLGCSIDELRKHLESQFQDGMTWENYGLHGWHIDHTKPCASFDLTLDEDQKKCFHYTNLQPLWAEDNLSKGDNYDHEPARTRDN